MGEKRDVQHFLDDITESIEKIIAYSSNLTEDEFQINFEKQDATSGNMLRISSGIFLTASPINFNSPACILNDQIILIKTRLKG